MRSYCNYHRHSMFSNVFFTDSPVSVVDYAKRAVSLGHKILSTCEHGFAGNHFAVYDIAKKNGLKMVFAAELYWVKDINNTVTDANGSQHLDSTNNHVVLIAKNESGRRAINRLITEANDRGFYKRPRADISMLLSLNPNDVMITTACVAFYGYGLAESEQIIRTLHSHFGDSMYLEVQAHSIEEQKAVNRMILRLYRTEGYKIIAGVDSHFIFPEQANDRKHLQAGIDTDADDDPEGMIYMDYPDGDELFNRFKAQGVLPEAVIEEAINNTNVVLTFEDFTFYENRTRKIPNPYPELTKEERDQKYLDLVYSALEKHLETIDPQYHQEYYDAVKYETDTVVEGGIADYCLLDYELVKRGVAKGGIITRSGRGSGASFITNTLLGFSTMDRIALPVKMFPDRFVSKPRLMAGAIPDLDLNVDDRTPFLEAQKEILGEEHCIPMIAYTTLQKKSAWKMYCRATNKDEQVIDQDSMQDISEALGLYDKAVKESDDDEEIDIADYVPEKYMDLYKKSEVYGGLISGKVVHPCAVLVYTGDIKSEIGLIRAKSKTGKNNELVTCVDGVTADKFGYVKNDILKVVVWKLIHNIYDAIGMPIPTTNELFKMVQDDEKTWKLFEKGYCLGVNQCEREKTKERLMRFKPRNFSELSAFVAAIRPGFASMLETFISRKHFDYGIPAFDSILQTKEMKSSFLLYQENIMSALSQAGFEPTETYVALKHIAKKHPDEIAKIKPRFVNGFLQATGSEEATEKVWQVISDASSYSFNACLAGDEVIQGVNDGYRPVTVEELYHRGNFDGISVDRAISLFDDGKLHNNRVVAVRCSGVRSLYKITLNNGMTIRCTSNHKFPTPNGVKMLNELKVKDKLYCQKPFERFGKPTTSSIISIKWVCVGMTYDVEMADPAHTFVTGNGIVTHNSHSAATAFDALYVAWAKANHPLETYYAMLSTYDDKEKIAKIKTEMYSAFGISVRPTEFGSNNVNYSIDRENNAIVDSLQDIPYMNDVCSKDLAQSAGLKMKSFTDALIWCKEHTAIDRRQMKILINIGYFRAYGDSDSLITISEASYEGPSLYKTTHAAATKAKRIDALHALEDSVNKQSENPYIMASKQARLLKYPVGIYDVKPEDYVVLSVDTQYSPKITMYSLRRGTTGVLKMRKSWYNNHKIDAGDCIRVKRGDWETRPKYTYEDGKRIPIPGTKECWMNAFEMLYKAKEIVV